MHMVVVVGAGGGAPHGGASLYTNRSMLLPILYISFLAWKINLIRQTLFSIGYYDGTHLDAKPSILPLLSLFHVLVLM